MKRIAILLLAVAALAPQGFAQAAQAAKAAKVAPPAPTTPRAFEFPAHATKKLANGLTVFVIEDHRLPLVSYSLNILAGNADQSPEKSGLASMVAGLLREGTATRTSQEIAKAVDTSGGSLGASAGDDASSVSSGFMKEYASLGMELLADIVLNPKFEQAEVDRQMRQAQSGLAVQYKNVEYLAPLASARAMLGTHPYAYPGDGTPATLRAITRDDIVDFHKRMYAPANAWLAIAGDVTPAEGFALAEKHLGGWKTAAPAARALPKPPEASAKVLAIQKADAVQTSIIVGHVGVPRNHPDYLALAVANQIFGGSFNSRLNMKLRANEGLTYGASSSFDPNRSAGLFTATVSTRTEKTVDAVRFIVDLLKEWKQNPATEAEFNEAKAYLLGSYGLSIETAGAIAGRVLTESVYQLPEGYFANYRKSLQALTVEQVRAAVVKHIQPDKLTVTLAGNVEQFAKPLEAFGPVTLIQANDIDFIAADLRKKTETTAATPDSAAKAQALLAQAVAAYGGKDAVLGFKTMVSKGKVTLVTPQGEFAGDVAEQMIVGEGYKMTLKLPMAEITQASDGKSAYIAQGAMSQELPAEMAGEMVKAAILASGPGLLQSALQGKAQIQVRAQSDVKGKMHDVIVWKREAAEFTMLLDPETHLITKVVYSSVGMQGPADFDVYLSEYKPVGGLMLPHAAEVFQNGQKAAVSATSERIVNAPLEASAFKKP